jgi:hypothetical protein
MKEDDQINDNEPLVISLVETSEIIVNTKSLERECDLKGKGWTTEMIKKYLGEPVRITKTKSGKPTGLYPTFLVKKALADPQVQELRKSNIKKREIDSMDRLRPIYHAMDNMTSNLKWLKEFIFQKEKEGKSTEEDIKIFNKLDKMASTIDLMHPKKFSSLDDDFKKAWQEKESILVKQALAILDISEESFIEFISKKKTAVMRKRL